MTDKEFEVFIEERKKSGIVLGLESMKYLLKKLGNPESKLKFVHVAGTNGKGSISSFIANILVEAGYKTGKYTSPEVVTYREKIQINGKNITKKAMYEGMEQIKEIVNNTPENIKPTFFEVETALAFWYFEKNNCDIAVIETGMGGIEDATNVITNTLVAVFATISYDHMAILGNTLEEIAEKKAGIIKRGCSVVSISQEDRVCKVLEETAKTNDADIIFVPSPKITKFNLNHQKFTTNDYTNLEIDLLGSYQPHNASVAVETVKIISQKGFTISEKNIRDGLKKTKWFGRFTVIKKKPTIIVDGAHNEGAAKALSQSITEYLKDTPMVFVMGMLRDKEYDKVLQIMGNRADAIVTLTPPNNARALSAIELANEASKYCDNVSACDSVEEACEIAELLAGKEKTILIFGSLSFLGKIYSIYYD